MTYISWSSDLEDFFDVWASLFGIISQYDPKFDLKINIGHCDLYFMVEWFCLISWRHFDVWTSYLGIMGQYDPIFDLKINVGLCNLYFMVQWFFLSYISKTIWCMSVIFSDSETVWPKLWPQSKYKSTWPIFHGPVILLNIFRIIWCVNIILWDYGSVRPDVLPQNKYRSMWPIFHGPVLLSYIPKTLMHECHVFR